MDQDAMIFMQSMRFCPTDAELIGYLDRRIAGSLPASNDIIAEADIWTTEPWNLPCIRGSPWWKKGECYYFTPRRMRSSSGNGSNVARAFKKGVWKANGTPLRVYDSKNNQIGLKTKLTFMARDSGNKTSKDLKTDWCMHEYILHSSANKFQDMAICRIYNKKSNQDDYGEWFSEPLSSSRSQLVSESSDNQQVEALGQSFSQPLGSCRTQDFSAASGTRHEESLGELISQPLSNQELEELDEWFSQPLSSWWNELFPQDLDAPADQEVGHCDSCPSHTRKRRRVSEGLKTDDIDANDTAKGYSTTCIDYGEDGICSIHKVMSSASPDVDTWCALDDHGQNFYTATASLYSLVCDGSCINPYEVGHHGQNHRPNELMRSFLG